MLFYFLISQIVLGTSTIASHSPYPNISHSTSNSFSKSMPLHLVQPSELRPLKPSNHRLMNMQHFVHPPIQHPMHYNNQHLLEHYRVQPNYYNPRNAKATPNIPHQWRMPPPPPPPPPSLIADNHFDRLPIDQSSFNNQIPRPPRLTRTQSENRRHYIDSPTGGEQPRPFNFPLEGPQPSQFKKTKKSKKKENKVNNIQDILRQEQIPPNGHQYQMPVGIHISGSFKNLQNSGISNVFRRYIQLQPQQQQMAPTQMNYQRVAAFDPFYPYKPKSLNDINSLAMKQLGLNRKKKKTNNTAVPGLVFQPSGQRPISADYYLDALRVNNSLNSLGGQRNLKHEPFSLKLEVYPIRSGKKKSVVPLTVAPPFLSTLQPVPQNFQPFYPSASQFGTAYGMPLDNSASYFNYMNINNPQRFKGKLVHSPSVYSSAYQRDKSPLESDGQVDEVTKPRGEKKQKSSPNQLLVHLNVFPSKKENNAATPPTPPPPPLPQNHLYDVIHADVHERSSKDLIVSKNETSYHDCDVGDKSFEDDVDSTETSLDYYQKGKSLRDAPVIVENFTQTDIMGHPLELRSNESFASYGNRTEKSEKFSTFRFPVENLLKFQANDAVINN